MTYNPLNLGSTPNDGSGDTLRAGGQKINTMFNELYNSLVRTRLMEDADYYVDTSAGNNTNSGVDPSHAFRTVAFAISVVEALDFNTHNVTIHVTGNVNESLFIQGAFVNAPEYGLTLQGDTVTPSNVTWNGGSGDCLLVYGSGVSVYVRGFKFTSAGGSALFGLNNGVIAYDSCDFGSCPNGYHNLVVSNGIVEWSSNLGNTISGGAVAHLGAFVGRIGGSAFHTRTLTGTPNFTDAFVVCEGALVDVENVTWVGLATGKRFRVNEGSIVPTFGSSLTYLPGNQPGVCSDAGRYNHLAAISSTDLGTVSSGSLPALDVSNTTVPVTRQWFYTNNGAHTLPAPTTDGALRVLVTNGASAGAITFTGFTTKAAPGDALNTTNGNKFLIEIFRINSISTYRVYALQ